MSTRPDFLRKKFGPLRDKTIKNALAHRIAKEFPRIGGPRICQLCRRHDPGSCSKHMRSRTCPARPDTLDGRQRQEPARATGNASSTPNSSPSCSTSRRPTTCNSGSIAGPLPTTVAQGPPALRTGPPAGGLLSNCDLAELLNVDDSRIAQVLAEHERQSQHCSCRGRATLHDVGTGLTHKRIICWKRYAEGKEPHVVARETYHSLEAVDRYLGQYDRVRHCRLEGLAPEQTAHALGCSLPLVKQYLAIDDLLEKKRG